MRSSLSFPLEKLNEVNSQQPQAFVRLHCSPDAFIAQLRSNHIHLVTGNYLKELTASCQTLGIRPIIPGRGE